MAALLLAQGCGAGDMGSDKSAAQPSANGYGGGEGDEYPYAGMDVMSAEDYGRPPEPEEEMPLELRAPQASEHYVYIAATSRDSLVRVDAETLEIRVIPVGGSPTTLATLKSDDVVLVINSGTQDFSIVRSSENDDSVLTLDMIPDVNAIAVSPDGKYAVVYYSEGAAAPGEPVGDFQTVAVVGLENDGESVSSVSTGFHTTAIYFHEAAPIAYLVTDDGISVIELDKVKEGTITSIIPVSANPLDDPSLREVLITTDGAFAVVRSLAKPVLSVVELATGELKQVDVAGLPTDIDLIPAAGRALVMLREQGLAYVADLAAIVLDGENALTQIDISGSAAGAAVITGDGSRAVLYTTLGSQKAIGVMDLNDEEYAWKSFPLQKSVVGVALSFEGSAGVVFHEVEGYAVEASDLEKTIAETNGFTLFNLDTGYRKLIQTKSDFTDYLFVSEEDGSDLSAFVLTPDPGQTSNSVQVADLSTYLVDQILLTSKPTSMVYVPVSRKVAIAQDHPNGRITFVDVDSGKTYSVSGYELNGLIH